MFSRVISVVATALEQAVEKNSVSMAVFLSGVPTVVVFPLWFHATYCEGEKTGRLCCQEVCLWFCTQNENNLVQSPQFEDGQGDAGSASVCSWLANLLLKKYIGKHRP